MQLWVKKRHAKAVKSTEAANPRLLVAKKNVMRASPHDDVARMLHVIVLYTPCEVAAPHDSGAFYMQVYERLNAVPRVSCVYCLVTSTHVLGVPLLIASETMRQSLKTKMEKGYVNCSL